MRQGARTPEELETLFEDALVMGDRDGLATLFDAAALVVADGGEEARGFEEIARLATEMWRQEFTYIAGPGRVLVARDTALVLAPGGTNVVRRDGNGSWRYAISLLEDHAKTERSRT